MIVEGHPQQAYEEEKKGGFINEDEKEKNGQLLQASYANKIPSLKPLSLVHVENDSVESSSVFGESENQSPWAARQ